jgi:hypothetical protein
MLRGVRRWQAAGSKAFEVTVLYVHSRVYMCVRVCACVFIFVGMQEMLCIIHTDDAGSHGTHLLPFIMVGQAHSGCDQYIGSMCTIYQVRAQPADGVKTSTLWIKNVRSSRGARDLFIFHLHKIKFRIVDA